MTAATQHGCKHKNQAIAAFETSMKKQHVNYRTIKCGMFIINNTDGYMQHLTFYLGVSAVAMGVERLNAHIVQKELIFRAMSRK